MKRTTAARAGRFHEFDSAMAQCMETETRECRASKLEDWELSPFCSILSIPWWPHMPQIDAVHSANRDSRGEARRLCRTA
jgi:hypothetical protein